MFVEFAGLTQRAATLIESFRISPDETKSDIIVRTLSRLGNNSSANHLPRDPAEEGPEAKFELGQGAQLRIGETAFLFLSENAKQNRRPHATAEVRRDGLYLFGKRIEASKGSVLQPAMRLVQEKLNHRNQDGEIISLSAWRQWHVERGGQLIPVLDLKDPTLARKRGRTTSRSIDKTAVELGL